MKGKSQKSSKESEQREQALPPMHRVPVLSPDGPPRETIEFIKVEDVCYYFTMNAVERGLIASHQVGSYPYRSLIYLRAANGRVYRSKFRSVRTLLRHLPAKYALKVNHGIVVNPDRITKLDPWAKKKEAIFHIETRTPHGDNDWIALSRDGARALEFVLRVHLC